MDTINNEALDALTQTVQSLMPSIAVPNLQPIVRVNPLKIAPAGIGGFVGVNEENEGYILGRRVEAAVQITVRSDNVDNLNSVVSTITRAFLAADRATLRNQGILRISLNEPLSVSNTAAEQDLTFNVLYEFLKRPQATEGTIQQIPLDMDISITGNRSRILLSSAFMQDSLNWFDIVDDPGANRNGPSQWQYNVAEQRIEQLSAIWNGSTAINPNKAGTYMVLRAGPTRPAVFDFNLRAGLRSDDDHGIGFVFRWQDVDNFYFFLMDSQRGYRLLGKKAQGDFQSMSTGGLDATQGYDPGVTYNVKLAAQGSVFRVYLNDALALEAEDSSLAAAGRVGFMCHRNDKAFFYYLSLTQL